MPYMRQQEMERGMSEARHWTGNDNRDGLGLDPDDEKCPDCGAGPLEKCTLDCGCLHCRQREWAQQDVKNRKDA